MQQELRISSLKDPCIRFVVNYFVSAHCPGCVMWQYNVTSNVKYGYSNCTDYGEFLAYIL